MITGAGKTGPCRNYVITGGGCPNRAGIAYAVIDCYTDRTPIEGYVVEVSLKRSTRNAKLTGGHSRPVWVMNPAGLYGSCPTTCAHLPRREYVAAQANGLPVADNPTNACYANARVRMHAARAATMPIDDAVADIVANMPDGGLLRWAEIGDVLPDHAAVFEALCYIRRQRPDIDIIAYTHAWRILPVRYSVMFHASCETLQDVRDAESLGYVAAITAPQNWTPADATAWRHDNNVGRVFVCPAATTGTNCADCRACDLRRSDAHVAFPAHGIKRRTASILEA